MAKTLVQFRTDEELKTETSEICEMLGIDLATYFRICMTRMVQEGGIPFGLRIENIRSNRGTMLLKKANIMAEENGTSNMTLDEINQEIAAARGEAKGNSK